MYILLSHSLSETTPAPGGRKALAIQVDEALSRGNVGNTFYYTTWNHAGTHVDTPGHMLPDGLINTDLNINHLVYENPCVVDVPKKDDELIVAADLQPYTNMIVDCDLLLLRTGFTEYRESDPLRYRDHNPGLSIEVAYYIAQQRFHKIRAIGIDSISIAATAHVHEGVQAHKILFTKPAISPVILIEDLDLSADLTNIRRVIVAPLFIQGLDSCPSTVIAEIESHN